MGLEDASGAAAAPRAFWNALGAFRNALERFIPVLSLLARPQGTFHKKPNPEPPGFPLSLEHLKAEWPVHSEWGDDAVSKAKAIKFYNCVVSIINQIGFG